MLTGIIGTIISLIKFFINTLTGFIQLLFHVPAYILILTNVLSMIPGYLTPFIMAGIYVGIMQFIVGRKVD